MAHKLDVQFLPTIRAIVTASHQALLLLDTVVGAAVVGEPVARATVVGLPVGDKVATMGTAVGQAIGIAV